MLLTSERIVAWQRWIVLTLAALAPVVIWRGGMDPFWLPKLTLILAGVVALMALAVYEAARFQRFDVLLTPAVYAAGAFVVVSLIATAASDRPVMSLVGPYKRYTGAVAYVGYAVVFVFVVKTWRRREHFRRLALALTVGAGIVAGYGILQALGADPFEWQALTVYHRFASTLGNPNFVAGYLGAVLPAPVGLALAADDRRWRLGFGAVAALLFAHILIVGSAQGPFTAAAGMGVLALAVILDQRKRIRSIGVRLWVAVIAAGGLLIGAGLLGLGPATRITANLTFRLRMDYWTAAINIVKDNPVLGVGVGRYAGYQAAYRTTEAAERLDLGTTVDHPHSVPLDMAAGGGIVLLLAYLAFVVAVAVAFVTGLRRLEGRDRLLLGTFGAVWAGYQVQSLVSIDEPPLALLHWLAAGAVIALSQSHTAALEGASRRRRRPRGGSYRRRATLAPLAGTALPVAILAIGAWYLSKPLRADTHIARAVVLADAEAYAPAIEEADQALQLAAWQPVNWWERGKILLDAGQEHEALVSMQETAERNPRDLGVVVTTARLARSLGEEDISERWYHQALDVEPHYDELQEEAQGVLDGS